MSKKAIIAISIFLLLGAATVWAEQGTTVSITGMVKYPLNLSSADLDKFDRSRIGLSEVLRDGSFRGVFQYEGVALKALLDLAVIEKTDSDFFKPIDLAIVARNRSGEQVVLAWGEVFYQNPASVILATSAKPVMPMTACENCHTPEEYSPWFDQLTREVGLPKLVLENDFYTDRCLEEVVNIEVVNLHPRVPSEKSEMLFSPSFEIIGGVRIPLTVDDLSSFRHVDMTVKQAGEGKGYHGLKRFRGVALVDVLKKAEPAENANSAILISAPDGYRSLLSYGELFLTSRGNNIILADKLDGKPIEENGKFYLILPDDLAADRWVKAVGKIEIIDFGEAPKLYVIGVGCGGADLITLEAISCMAKADAYVCSKDLKERFAKYMGDKPVLFDPIESLERFFHQEHPNLSSQEREAKLMEQRAIEGRKVTAVLDEGKTVAYLDYGDPSIYGSWRFLAEYVSVDAIEFVPGISSFNAASALLKRDVTCNGSLIMTAPQGLQDKESMIQAIAESGDTLVIFMGLREFRGLIPLLGRHYSSETPVALVYEAGIPGKERILRTTLADAVAVAEHEGEKWLGLIYIGECIEATGNTCK